MTREWLFTVKYIDAAINQMNPFRQVLICNYVLNFKAPLNR
jgi:hypothetical protein